MNRAAVETVIFRIATKYNDHWLCGACDDSMKIVNLNNPPRPEWCPLRPVPKRVERCANCKFCYELYTPPTVDNKSKFEYCCICCFNEGYILNLGNDICGPGDRCECFTEKDGCDESKVQD